MSGGSSPPEALELAGRRAELLQAIARAGGKLRTRLKAISADEQRAIQARQHADDAKLFVAAAARLARGSPVITAICYDNDGAHEASLPLDPARNPLDQLNAIFALAKRLQRGSPIRQQRREQTQHALGQLLSLTELASAATRVQQLAELFGRLASVMPAGAPRARAVADRARRPVHQAARCFKEYHAKDGTAIWVGRSASDNDELTTRLAKAHDLWMHVCGCAGSHVIVRVPKSTDPAAEVLLDGATLAVHFSEARGRDFAEVQWCERRFVRKPRKSPPGAVVTQRRKILAISPDPARLSRLLETHVPA